MLTKQLKMFHQLNPFVHRRKLQPIPPHNQIFAAHLKAFLYKARTIYKFRIAVFVPTELKVENATPNLSAWV